MLRWTLADLRFISMATNFYGTKLAIAKVGLTLLATQRIFKINTLKTNLALIIGINKFFIRECDHIIQSLKIQVNYCMCTIPGEQVQ